MPQKNFHIAIVGGGIAGITLAISLLKRGISCAVYEQGRAFSEIGAGVAFGPNAVRAMGVCDASVLEAFERVATHNQSESKRTVYFDFIDGTQDAGDGVPIFTLENEQGANSVHRGHFMDEMAKLVPEGVSHFRKRLDRIVDVEGGKLRLLFQDGTDAEADAVIGCDGIKSRTRAIMFGDDHPCAHPTYTHKYAYRAIAPMTQAVEAMGEERALNACLWMGPKAHLLTFPIAHGNMFNMVAFCHDSGDWPSHENLTLPARKEDAIREFQAFGPAVLKKLELAKPDVDRWGMFDLGDHPLPTFYKGRICLSGDAAHATTPHHGAGAGFCIEDSAVLVSLLVDERVRGPEDLEAVFATYDANRRERDQWLVQDSRRMGGLYEWNAPDVGKDFKKIEREIREGFGVIWDYDIKKGIQEATADLAHRLGK